MSAEVRPDLGDPDNTAIPVDGGISHSDNFLISAIFSTFGSYAEQRCALIERLTGFLPLANGSSQNSVAEDGSEAPSRDESFETWTLFTDAYSWSPYDDELADSEPPIVVADEASCAFTASGTFAPVFGESDYLYWNEQNHQWEPSPASDRITEISGNAPLFVLFDEACNPSSANSDERSSSHS